MAEKLNLKTLREKPKADLLAKLGELKNELSQLRVAKVTGGAASKLGKIREVRKQIAQVLTVYNQTRRSEVKTALKNKKYQPLDLRPRQTRAMRRRLSPKQAAATTLRERKRLAHFSERKFALKA